MVEVKRGEPGSSKSNPYKPAEYRHIPTSKFGCVINVDGRYEAKYPLNTKSRVNNAKTRMEAFEKKPETKKCIRAGLKKNICAASKREGLSDTPWFEKNC